MDEDIQKTIRENIMEESRKIITKFSTPSEEMITLDDILNLWDGLRETPGRILVISSNHYDRLDAAIRRPGRIDITLGLKNISHNTLREMYKHFYKSDIDESRLLSIEEDLYSPAEITNLYTLYRENSDAFMDRLCENRKLV
jgi:SpoVK/Ycf46/Vps4 family AAA+-type ATPase